MRPAGASPAAWETIAGGAELVRVTTILSDDGPGNTADIGCEMTSAPFVPMNRVTRDTLRCSPPTPSHGIQMLYDGPTRDSLKCAASSSAVITYLRSGGWPGSESSVSSQP